MIRKFTFSPMFAIVIAFASLVIALPSAAQDLADVIEKCERSVVRIEVKGKDGDSLGSGFIVDGSGIIAQTFTCSPEPRKRPPHSHLSLRILPTGDYRRQHRQPTCGTSVLTPKQNDFKLYFGMGDYGPRPE